MINLPTNLASITAKWRLINTILFIIFLFLPWMHGCNSSANDTLAENSPRPLNGFYMVLLAAIFFLQFISDLDTDISATFFWLGLTTFPFLLIVYHLIFSTYQLFEPNSISQWWRWSVLFIIVLETIFVVLPFGLGGLLIGFWLTICLVASSLALEIIERLTIQYSVLPLNNRSPP